MKASKVSAAKAAPLSAPPLEQAVVELVQELTPDRLGPEARVAVSTLMRDQLAVQIGSSRLPWSKQILTFAAKRQLPGRSSVVGSQLKMSATDAAFVNAVYGHGFEYDDAHRVSASHPGCCVVPTALALGEELDASLDEVITALVVGYEVYTRIGNLAAPDLLQRGFHPHAVLSVFGAAAITAKLRRFDAETTLNTLAIALSHASGTGEFTSTGGSVKRVHSGIGVRSGMASADMAEAGITGPRAFLSGTKGFYRTFLQKTVSEQDTRRFYLAGTLEVQKLWLKPYCCCGCIHAYIDAIRPFAPRVSEIESVVARIQRSANVVVGTVNANAYTPKNIEHVQFSLPIQMAFTMLGLGNGYRVHLDYLEGRVDMEAVMATAERIRIIEDQELDRKYPGKFVADLTVEFRDGSSEQMFVEDSIGTLDNPIPAAEHDAKFFELTSGVLGTVQAERLREALFALDPQMRAAELAALCRA
ncbi:MAG: MmgE/PrpD family protein [Variovorax sp.]|nr:MAG: MmgE/PrpD family protein [Variovorax sp.]